MRRQARAVSPLRAIGPNLKRALLVTIVVLIVTNVVLILNILGAFRGL